jgi:hypothetical protein
MREWRVFATSHTIDRSAWLEGAVTRLFPVFHSLSARREFGWQDGGAGEVDRTGENSATDGPERQLAQFLDAERPALLIFAAAQMGDALRAKVEADDIVQDALIHAIRNQARLFPVLARTSRMPSMLPLYLVFRIGATSIRGMQAKARLLGVSPEHASANSPTRN